MGARVSNFILLRIQIIKRKKSFFFRGGGGGEGGGEVEGARVNDF